MGLAVLEYDLKIEWLVDYHDCDTCGYSTAEGARVYVDGVLLFELVPVAHCYGGQSWSDSEVYKSILDRLGYKVTESYVEDVDETIL